MIEIETCPVCNGKSFNPYLTCTDHTVSHETFKLVRCQNCQLVITSPKPETASLQNYYLSADYISHTNRAKTIIDRLYLLARSFTLKWKIDLIEKHAPPTEKLSILDYGCGTGHFLSACYERNWNISGVEPSDQARQNADTQVRPLICNSITELSEISFDVITLWHVLEHIPDPTQALQTITARLKQNGTLIIAIPNHKSWDATFYKEHWAGYDVPRHLWHFSQPNVVMLAKKLSLQLVETIPMKLDAYYVSLLSEKYKNPNKKISNLLQGFVKGLTSNLKASKTRESSSLIYILKKT